MSEERAGEGLYLDMSGMRVLRQIGAHLGRMADTLDALVLLARAEREQDRRALRVRWETLRRQAMRADLVWKSWERRAQMAATHGPQFSVQDRQQYAEAEEAVMRAFAAFDEFDATHPELRTEGGDTD